MVDKMAKMAIIISATLLNKFGKEPGTGALSHSVVNQTEYFGFKATRLITELFNGVATTNSNRSDWAGGFLLTKKQTALEDADTSTRASTASLQRRLTMRRESITSPSPEANSGNDSNQIPLSIRIDLAQRNIDNLMAQMVSQMESLAAYMRELAALKQGGVSCD